jgi:hypothetical protein
MQTLLVNVKPRVLKTLIKAMAWYLNPPTMMKPLDQSSSYHEIANDVITDKIRSLYKGLAEVEKLDEEYMQSYQVRGNTIVLSIVNSSTGMDEREVILSE